ncbi:DNA replication protein DnaC [Caldalkalibacillus uzonensis]|uniref:DNA replication protein DnaC n=1 Tax=Caldalkalibacillus uzonensis TaxID=353224 RepID=A0ABU0CWY4_9BACI|nr:DNA replication protein DnaC [Caldalkalibacillus uzonensis]
MSESLVQLKHSLKALKLASIAEVIEEQLMEAETNGFSYQQFLTKLLGYEIRKREEKQLAKRLKWADFPVHQSLDEFDIIGPARGG